MRDRQWIEINMLAYSGRVAVDANKIEGEPMDRTWRHTPPLDRSGELWLPGQEPRPA